MKITIVGAGAIGLLWGTHLSQHHSVHFWTRDNASSLNITVQSLPSQSDTPPSAPCTFDFVANHTAWVEQADCVLVTVKAFQVLEALQAIQPYLAEKTPVIIMHNGMGTHEAASALLPHQPLLYATTAQAALRPERHQLHHTGLGQTWLGALNAEGAAYSPLASVFDRALAPCQWHDDIFQPLWQKLAINCAINPLTAIHQCRNGELAHSDFDATLSQICEEVAAVMNAEGYPTNATQLRTQVDTVIQATAQNFSSMHQDVSHHRTTEIDYITGYLIARAQAHQLTVPTNAQLWQQVKQLEQHTHDA